MAGEIFQGLGVMYFLSVVTMFAVIVAMTVDFFSGWRKAHLRGEKHTSYAASRSFTKFLIYEGMLLIGSCMDTMIHFAWPMFMDNVYAVPLATIVLGIILCIVEIWSVKEKADHKQRKRINDAAEALATLLGRETIMELLRTRLDNKEDITYDNNGS